MIKDALHFFFKFHKGGVNIALHVAGFLGIFYSVFKLDWRIFAISFIVLESGHLYNHLAGIEKYDIKPKTIFWRGFLFIVFVVLVYFVEVFIKGYF